MCAFLQLCFYCCVYSRITVAEKHGAESKNIINIVIAINISKMHAFSTLHDNRIFSVGRYVEGASYTVNKILSGLFKNFPGLVRTILFNHFLLHHFWRFRGKTLDLLHCNEFR